MALGENFPALLDAARAGAEWAITSIYREHQPLLLRYLSARAGSEGEDLAATTWLDVARSIGGFDGTEEHFRRWLYTIANRRLIDWLRQRSRRPVAADAENVADSPDLDPDPGDAVVASISGTEAARHIAALLPADQAEIVLLRVVGGFTVDEVAEITGRRPGTVRVMAHRALRKLARELSPDV